MLPGCGQTTGAAPAEPELGDIVQDVTDDAGAWMWKSLLPAIWSAVSSQRDAAC